MLKSHRCSTRRSPSSNCFKGTQHTTALWYRLLHGPPSVAIRSVKKTSKLWNSGFTDCSHLMPTQCKPDDNKKKKKKSNNLGAFYCNIQHIFNYCLNIQPLFDQCISYPVFSLFLLKPDDTKMSRLVFVLTAFFLSLMGTKPLPRQIHTTCNRMTCNI